jgi:hypothetical protein
MATLSPSAYRTIKYEWMAELMAKKMQNEYRSTVNADIADPELAFGPNTSLPKSNPPRMAVGTDKEAHHQMAAYLSGGDCLRGLRASWGVQLCIWPYTMMNIARKAPVSVLLHPIPDSGFLKKNGSGTSNHKSRDPNKNTRDKDKMLMLYLFLQSRYRDI